MIPSANPKERGIVYTFYSFKGGMGRTMALANVSVLLAKWGRSVLIVDWDLEAPGVERFFAHVKPDIRELCIKRPGVVELVQATGTTNRLTWRDCLMDIDIGGGSGRLSMIGAGRRDNDYNVRLQSLDFPQLFDKHGLGSYIEELRKEWVSEFEFVLIDSRTGFTDIGGICTVHLADVLVVFFTTTESSTEGALQIVERARRAQERLPVDRGRLFSVPVPARDESRTEYERATKWKNKFADQFGELYRDWLPSGKTPHDAIDLLRIPYVPYWSFGEQLPVIDEGTSDPASIGHAYEILARLLAARLDWYTAMGQGLAPPPTRNRRELDRAWLQRHRSEALASLSAVGINAYMEICHFLKDSFISKTQPELLTLARQAQVHTFGWPIGIVLENNEESRPKPTNEGIVANVSKGLILPGRGSFDYWTLNRSGDFYTLMSLFEDDRSEDNSRLVLYFDTRIVRATEAVLHCINLYRSTGIEPNAHVEITVRYYGLRGRTLAAASPQRLLYRPRKNILENEVSIPPITFSLGVGESDIVELVKKLCAPLFAVFDYEEFDDTVYRQIVTDFLKEKLA